MIITTYYSYTLYTFTLPKPTHRMSDKKVHLFVSCTLFIHLVMICNNVIHFFV